MVNGREFTDQSPFSNFIRAMSNNANVVESLTRDLRLPIKIVSRENSTITRFPSYPHIANIAPNNQEVIIVCSFYFDD